MESKKLGILVFTDAEVLDFAGPFEVFSVTNELSGGLDVLTVAKEKKPVRARNGLTILPDVGLADCPPLDFLLIPGGFGTRALLKDDVLISWIVRTSDDCETVLSVCSGALVLARAGLLDGLSATTHHQVFGELEGLAPATTIVKEQRFVDNGQIITAAGVTAGIDMSLYFVSRLYGRQTAEQTARYMEWNQIF